MPCKNSIQYFYNRLCHWRNLLFFIMTLASCQSATTTDASTVIVWQDSKAVAVNLAAWLKDIPLDSIPTTVTIISQGDQSSTSILGNFRRTEPFLFEPVVPFSYGRVYDVLSHNKKIGSFEVPVDGGPTPRVVASYPAADTLPENLLKFYLQFSSPMMEGRSAQYIALVKNGTDTLRNVLLDLQTELWNQDRTVLTVWLDPGRIKRDLQPNLKLGNPLHREEKYTLIVLKGWKNTVGSPTQENYTREFVTTARKEQSPDPSQWKINLPAAQSTQGLSIEFNQPLDHFLLLESLMIKDASGKTVAGNFVPDRQDKSCIFTPGHSWIAGKYSLVIRSRLEDLAGNNLNRPFDRDVTKTKQPSTQASYSIDFLIR